ncbi:hypothetical protein pb186bvf_009574 [Paramecium bursaria]
MNVVKFEHQELVNDLRKQLNKAKSENAILDQKVRILEQKLKEYDERNCNIQKMNGTIMNVLNELNTNQLNVLILSIYKVKQQQELQKVIDGHNMKISQLTDKCKSLEQANKTLQNQLQESVIQKNELSSRMQQVHEQNISLIKQIGAQEQVIKMHIQQIDDSNNQKSQLTNIIEDLQFDSQKQKFELDCRIEELNEENQQLKNELKLMVVSALKKTQSQMSSLNQSPQKENFKSEKPEKDLSNTKSRQVNSISVSGWKPSVYQKITPSKKWK